MWVPRSGRLLCLTASSFLFGPWVSPATSQLLGPEFQVHSTTAGQQRNPAVAADGLGNFVVAWQSYPQDGSNYGVIGQRFNSAGAKVGSEFQVNNYTTGLQTGPAVAADSSGNFVVLWGSVGPDGSNYGVVGQRFDPGGGELGSEFQVNSYTTSIQRFPAVAADGAGNFVVVWDSFNQDGSDYGVFGQRFDSAGGSVGSEFQVNTHISSSQSGPAVATGPSGNFVVAWTSFAQDGSSYGVFGQAFDAAGSEVGSEFQVNAFTTSHQRRPAVATDASGNFVVVWDSYLQDGDSLGVFGQRFDSTGSKVGSEFLVNSTTTGDQSSPRMAMDGSGKFVVAWLSNPQDGSYEGVFGQRFDAVARKVGSEFRINSYTTGRQERTAVAADGSGNFVVAWQSPNQDGSLYGVFGQRLRNWIFHGDFAGGDICAWSAQVGSGDTCP